MPCAQAATDDAPADLAALFLDIGETTDSKLTLFGVQVSCVRRGGSVGKAVKAIYGHWQGDEKVNDEEPSPAREAVPAIHAAVDTSLEKPREQGPSQSRTGKDGCSFPEFLGLVPAAEHVVDTDKGGSFKDGLEEANEHDLLWTVCEGRSEGEQSPTDHGEGEVDAWRHLLDCQVVWDLAKDIAAIEYCPIRSNLRPSWG